MHLPRLALALLLLASPAAADRWVSQYFYDENESSFVITALKFPSVRRGIACGYQLVKGKSKPAALVTSDGGSHWALVPLKEYPQALFFLDDSLGWMVTDKGIWRTEEAGRTWTKMPLAKDIKDLRRIAFLDRNHGFLTGERKQVYETTDGGTTWTPVRAAAEPKTNPDTTIYQSISFGNERDGIIGGWTEPPSRASLPDWVDPQNAGKKRQAPSTLVLLQTRDGGKTWSPSITSIFGRVTQISIAPDGTSIGLIEFFQNFPWPSEAYYIDPVKGFERIFRESNRWITDAVLTPSHSVILSGSEVTGTVHDNPIPGKLKVVRSLDMRKWEELPVDYRATAHTTFLATPDGEHFWLATDTGMILKLEAEDKSAK